MAKAIVISELVIATMLKEARFTEEFSFLRAAPAIARRCYCNGENRITYAADPVFVKQQIINLSPERKQRLKELLKADEVKVFLPSPTGKPITEKF